MGTWTPRPPTAIPAAAQVRALAEGAMVKGRASVLRRLPVVLHNAESRGRAERSGLTLLWRGPDAGNPDPDAARLVYADRPVDDDLLARVTAHA